MRLSRKIEQAFGLIIAISLVIVFAVVAGVSVKNASAEGDGEQGTYITDGEKFVTFYDEDSKGSSREGRHRNK